MHQLTRHPAFFAGVTIICLFLLSLVLFLVSGGEKVTRTFFFPTVTRADRNPRQKISGETRVLPVFDRPEENVRLLLEEIILGPLEPDHGDLVNPETDLLSVVLDKDILYANFSDEMLRQSSRLLLPLEKQLQAVANTVLFNFRFIDKVYLFVDGDIPDFGHEQGDDRYDFSNGIPLSSRIME